VKVVPRSGRARLVVALAAVLLLLAPVAWMWWSSLLPDRYDIAEMGYADYGGGAEKAHDHQGSGTPVADLVEARGGPADVEVTLTVRTDGDRYTVNGSTPGPEIRVTEGEVRDGRCRRRHAGRGPARRVLHLPVRP
jgi:FtsP/CotA-like multicopper oxidase with cupredoxin domain